MKLLFIRHGKDDDRYRGGWSNKSRTFKAENCGIHILDMDTMKFETENMTEFMKN